MCNRDVDGIITNYLLFKNRLSYQVTGKTCIVLHCYVRLVSDHDLDFYKNPRYVPYQVLYRRGTGTGLLEDTVALTGAEGGHQGGSMKVEMTLVFLPNILIFSGYF